MAGEVHRVSKGKEILTFRNDGIIYHRTSSGELKILKSFGEFWSEKFFTMKNNLIQNGWKDEMNGK
jgi:hypothetical protein